MPKEQGPFHRRKAPTQTYQTALLQLASGELWGRASNWGGGGLIPKVKAYLRPLCHGEPSGSDCHDGEGVEFTTESEPSGRAPDGLVFWHEDRGGPTHRIDDDTIAINISISKVVYTEAK